MLAGHVLCVRLRLEGLQLVPANQAGEAFQTYPKLHARGSREHVAARENRGGEARSPYPAWRRGVPAGGTERENRCHGNGQKVDQLPVTATAARGTARGTDVRKDVHEWVGDRLTSRSSTGSKKGIGYVASSRSWVLGFGGGSFDIFERGERTVRPYRMHGPMPQPLCHRNDGDDDSVSVVGTRDHVACRWEHRPAFCFRWLGVGGGAGRVSSDGEQKARGPGVRKDGEAWRLPAGFSLPSSAANRDAAAQKQGDHRLWHRAMHACPGPASAHGLSPLPSADIQSLESRPRSRFLTLPA
jgi:hypothetical protein